MSQLLCEQVVGRGLRRSSYAVGEDDKLGEEVAKIFGVPFEIVPLKENPPGSEPKPAPTTWRIRAVPEKAHLEIRFPRIEGYTQAIRHRVTVDWESIAPLPLDPMDIPPEVEMKAGLPSNTGRPSLVGPGRLERIDLNPYREGQRLQHLVGSHAGLPAAARLRRTSPRSLRPTRHDCHPLPPREGPARPAGAGGRRLLVALVRMAGGTACRRDSAERPGGRERRIAAYRAGAETRFDGGG